MTTGTTTSPDRGGSDHDRVVGSGAWAGLFAFALVMCWADARLAPWAAFLLTWAAVLPVTFAMAVWKRAWYGWAAWWGLVGLCAFTAVADLATGLLARPFGLAADVSAVVFVFLWYWLIRMPRRRPAVAAAGSVSHVVHHHVLHPGGVPVPGWSAEVEAPAVAELTRAGRGRSPGVPWVPWCRDTAAGLRGTVTIGDMMPDMATQP